MTDLISITKLLMKKKRDVILSIVFGYLAGITAVGLFAANGYLISRAALEPPLYVLITMVAVVKFGSFLRATSRYAERYYSHRATFTMLSEIRVHFYEKLEQVAPKLYQRFQSGDLLSRVVGDVESLQNYFLRVLYPPILMVTIFLSTLLFISFYSIDIVIILTIGLILTGIIVPAWFAQKQKRIGTQKRDERGKLSTEVTEWFYGFRELKLHSQLEEKKQKVTNLSTNYIHQQSQEDTKLVYNQSINTAIALVISWAVLAMGVFLVSTGQLDGLFLAMLVMVSITVFEHSTPMSTFSNYYEESNLAARRLQKVSEESEIKTDKKPVKSLSHAAPSIELNRVSLTFPGEYRHTLQDVSLHLPAGSKTAIVGPSGSGKSTLLQLLLTLQEPSHGRIHIDGISIEELEKEKLWEKVSIIFQENHFFYGTLKDNLLLQDSTYSDDQLTGLLADVQLSGFSLDDQVLEKGQNLSGGEKQRLAMARAIAKNGSLWLLDEPTSSLDTWTERKIYEVMFRKAKSATIVLVSHRLNGLEAMDQIVVMDKGEIVETGTYKELLDKKGYFYKMKEIEQSVIC
ncbi:thiol reductant ABC exporter subunit CydC [Bacillus alkalicellulosilyticus]|uniref:thiol reductant ABC exporter subunit CydC n=1 Tax=Alkalihalobacterium alkalicellulosilyticum TaxID=1912214 RepID=UPI000996263F|nr:thiol reductant ABC exporter subunit CydC [Bacillus alkalicellulosilyticus]